MAKSKQKIIDTNKEKIVADNILLAQSRSDARQAENNEYQKELKERFEQEIKLKQKQMTEAIEEAKENCKVAYRKRIA
ncbi:MAG: hypothetical protein IPL50_07660 [Chitinophagaceae bacterium]|nr:hypothetical protein [Chitinophagaceae bacterium]